MVAVRGWPFSMYTNVSEKNNISYPLIRTCKCVYRGVGSASFS